jgi:hypothetical protein
LAKLLELNLARAELADNKWLSIPTSIAGNGMSSYCRFEFSIVELDLTAAAGRTR